VKASSSPASQRASPSVLGSREALQGVIQNDDFRYNFFMVEVAGRPTVHLTRFDSNGAIVGQKDYSPLAYEQLLVNVTDILPVARSTAARCWQV
jgi:hypothetical protein